MAERAGIVIFTLWYIAIAVNYIIAPIFERRNRNVHCRCARAPCSNTSSSSCFNLLANENSEPEPKGNSIMSKDKESYSQKSKGSRQASRASAEHSQDLLDAVVGLVADSVLDEIRNTSGIEIDEVAGGDDVAPIVELAERNEESDNEEPQAEEPNFEDADVDEE